MHARRQVVQPVADQSEVNRQQSTRGPLQGRGLQDVGKRFRASDHTRVAPPGKGGISGVNGAKNRLLDEPPPLLTG